MIVKIVRIVNILVSGEGPTNNLNGSASTADKKFSINFSKRKAIFLKPVS